jgi:hypothetical protein
VRIGSIEFNPRIDYVFTSSDEICVTTQGADGDTFRIYTRNECRTEENTREYHERRKEGLGRAKRPRLRFHFQGSL